VVTEQNSYFEPAKIAYQNSIVFVELCRRADRPYSSVCALSEVPLNGHTACALCQALLRVPGCHEQASHRTTMSAVQSAVAAPTQNTSPTSYRDLLEPVPDALNALKIDDARTAAKTQGGEQVAQYYYHHHHHHHHHHGGFGVYIR
ncbi:MAG: hypothetical protein WA728_08475, partial [Xanthobacteraceae bacterium]